jgi:ABC-2 type transport system permease protein
MLDVLRSPIRGSAFLTKEIAEIVRQPRLILTLALGPFIILLLFGLGFRNEARAFRTLFVAPAGDALSQRIEEYATTLGPQLLYQGITTDTSGALERLRRGQVDLVIQVPAEAEATIRANQQAIFTLYHNEIDPQQTAYVQYFGQLYVGEVNRRIVQAIMAEGQGEAATVQDDVSAARLAATGAREALERGDAAAAHQQQDELDTRVSALELAVGASAGLLRGVEQTVGADGGTADSDAVVEQLTLVRTGTNALEAFTDDGDYAAEIETATQVENDLIDLETQLTEFTSIEPYVIVSPFRSEAASVANVTPDITAFFAPAVLALLLQHVAVTFGALSLVRERQLGVVEIFRVSPISPGEVLTGKYLSNLIFGGVLAALLILLIITALGVPMLGSWFYLTATILLLLLASLGIGFVISLISATASQAVQASMLVLLASVFFSGFFVALHLLWPAVQVVSWMLPVTYGIQMFQSIMLRGVPPDPRLLAGLALITLVMFVLAWLLTWRLMRHR